MTTVKKNADRPLVDDPRTAPPTPSLPAREVRTTRRIEPSAPEQTGEARSLEEEAARASAGRRGVAVGGNVYSAQLDPNHLVPLAPSSVDQIIRDALPQRREEAYGIMDRALAEATVAWEDGQGARLLSPLAGARIGTGLDMGRQIAGLVMLAEVATASGDPERAAKYLEAAEQSYAAGRKVLTERTFFVHQKDFSTDPPTVTRGEPGQSAAGEDEMSRVNPRAYAIRAAAELYRITGKSEYRLDLVKYLSAFVGDHHDRQNGGFFIHANIDPAGRGDHQELVLGGNTIKTPGGEEISKAAFPDAIIRADGTVGGLAGGIKGNDGTIYALSSILLPANEILASRETQALVKEQMDLILDRFQRVNGMLWENYSADWKPISVGWQSQEMEGQPGRTSHVAIGGHTAMAPQQIIEGARQLERQGAISKKEANRYVDRALELFQAFATQSGAVDWNSGAVHNAIRVEEPRAEQRWLAGWGDAAWQQAELIQTLLRFREEGRLAEIVGPTGKNNEDLLRLAEGHYRERYSSPADVLTGFGNEWLYHPHQLLQYHHQVVSRLPDTEVQQSARVEGAKVLREAAKLLEGGASEKLDAALERLADLARTGGVPFDAFRDPATGQSFAMMAAARGATGAYLRALEHGSDPSTDINPITGQTHAHYAALIFDRGDGGAAAILGAMETKIGLAATVQLVNRRVGQDRDPPLSLHTAYVDAVFNRNGSAEAYLRDLAARATAAGMTVDVTSPTARGIRAVQLTGRSPGSFSAEALAFLGQLPTTVRGRDGTPYENDREMRRAEHTAWARQEHLDPERVLRLVDAMEGSSFDETSRLLHSLGLDWNSKVGYLEQTPLYFNSMSPSPPDAKADFQRRAIQAGASVLETEEGLMLWHLAGRQGALSAAADFAGGTPTGNSLLALETLEQLRRDGGPAYREVLDARGIMNGRTLLADVLYGLNWPLARELLRAGADPSIRGYDGVSMLELAQKFASDNGQALPADLIAMLREG